jgi:D-tyrosyl-tRNA(Tyr) deacylase
MNCSLGQAGGALLVVSQFTLLADANSGRRPSFTRAAAPDEARRLYQHFLSLARMAGVKVETGEFGATMDVELVNDGPVTIILDSRDK